MSGLMYRLIWAGLGHLHFTEQFRGLSGNAPATGDGIRFGGANEAGRPDIARLLRSGHAGGDGCDLFARRLGGGHRGVAGAFGNADFSSQPPVARAFAHGHFGRRRDIFCHQLFVEDAQLHSPRGNTRDSGMLDFTVRRDIWIGGRSKCGGIIFGGASGRRITTIVSGNIVRKMSR